VASTILPIANASAVVVQTTSVEHFITGGRARRTFMKVPRKRKKKKTTEMILLIGLQLQFTDKFQEIT
jgi:hypothetical protein